MKGSIFNNEESLIYSVLRAMLIIGIVSPARYVKVSNINKAPKELDLELMS